MTAGGNLAFMNAVLAITDPGDEIVLLVPYYFNHEMAVVMAGAQAVAVPTTSSYQLDVRGDRGARSRRERVRSSRCRRTIRLARSTPGGAAGGQRALPRPRHLPHPRRGLRILHLWRRRAFFAGQPARGGRPHHLALLAVEGLRHGELADRLHGDSRGAGRSRQQDPGHDPHLSARRLAARRDCRARGWPIVCRRPPGAPGCDAPRDLRGAGRSDVPCDVPSPDGAFYYLVRVHSRWTR